MDPKVKERSDIVRRVYEQIRTPGGPRGELLEELWAYQTQHCSAMHLHAQHHDLIPGKTTDLDSIVPLHTSAFRWGDLISFPAEETQIAAEFRSSGTTVPGQQSRHLLHSLELYEASVLAAFSSFFPELEKRDFQIISLLPESKVWPNSSLVHMFDTLIRRYDEEHGVHACDHQGTPDIKAVKAAIKQARARCVPVLLLGAAFSHVMLLDDAIASEFCLPEESVVLETGGTKGRTRSIDRDELMELISKGYQIPESRLLREYGMAELGSQAFGWGHSTTFEFPSWVHIDVCDPDTGMNVAEGTPGILRIYDPINVDSCSFIETSDLAVKLSSTSFQLLGRALQSDPRGCSLLIPGELPESIPASKSSKGLLSGIHSKMNKDFPIAIRGEALAQAWALMARSGNIRGRGIAQMVGDSMGLSQAAVSEALARESDRWTSQRISELISREVAPFQTGRIRPEPVGQVLIIPASTVPFSGLESVTIGLLAGASVDIRPSRRNPAEISFFVRALERCAPKLKERVRIIAANDERGLATSIAHANSIIVHGAEDTIEYFQQRSRTDTRLVSYGPRWSMLALTVEDAQDKSLMRSVAQDILLHDSLGCLSPRLVMVMGLQSDALKATESLGEMLKDVSAEYPPHEDLRKRSLGAGFHSSTEATLAHTERGLHSYKRFGSSHLFVLNETMRNGPALDVPLPLVRRGTIVANIPERSDLHQYFGDTSEAVSTLAMGPDFRKAELGESLEQWAIEKGASRVTSAGRMQRPPSGWPHDGGPLLLPFLHLVTPG